MKKFLSVCVLTMMVLLLPFGVADAKEYYEVSKGDSLWGISNKHNVSVQKIKEWNKLKNDLIFVGQKLIVSEKKQASGSSQKTYKVKAGDTLWKISNDFGVTVQELASWNKINGNIISVGQVLQVSGSKSSSKPPANNNNKDKDSTVSYTVKRGDTLWSISRDHKVTVEELIKWNGLSDTILLIGQKLNIKEQGASSGGSTTTKATTTDNLNMRTSPSTSASILLTIPKGSTIDVLNKNGTWWEVRYNKKTGYAHSGYLTEGKKETYKARVTAGALYMRTSGSASSSAVTIMPNGAVVDVLDDSKEWWQIRYDNKVGYSNSKYMEKMNGKDSETQKPNGKVVILDPGHGGPDPGAVNGSIQENHLNMTFANKTKDYLQRLGYTVHLTRNGNTDSCAGSSGTVELQCRVDFANNKKGDVFVSIHNNTFSPGVRGTETYYSASTSHASQSKALADAVHRSYQPAFGSNDRKVKTANFLVIRNTTMPSILLEIGFISDVNGDLPKLTNSTVQDRVSKAIADGIHNYLK